ncbi:MAG: helix-turn-helix transcriptional regulator [Limosilactobacillus oris]|jgi:transcriptional regulator with XRE-family HTH domain|uniref:helix-turn-helix domain-containing protein n=1 Tax=Limosilactobacillus oris TaxID=1632 RepID=UPI002432949A|nr:helix-turn-helix transcriptional regulator [Limosilactobacillus oris]MCH3911472.1 helix-turn-helix transcriptional regulator [Limosilactobacillus oris]MCH3938722.1 helix-turn-helix transcriptional regulator [Limosilactobacillus oris]MCI1980150.1 helix-turn-helix transcriptional regulator [Limosilactobacillus oris]MCI2042908.1 helix-turn-helix transcriptional regulator [Limosilactobacillus oris]
MLWKSIQTQLDKKHITVYRLAKLTSIPNNTLYEYKNNDVQPTFNNMIKIADALDVSLDIFRKGDDDR